MNYELLQALFGGNLLRGRVIYLLQAPYQNFLPVVLLCRYHNHTHLLTMFITSSLLQIGGISALSLHKKQSSAYNKYACGCFLYAPSIYTAYLQKSFQYRHGWRWFSTVASLIYKLAIYRCTRTYIDRKAFFNCFFKPMFRINSNIAAYCINKQAVLFQWLAVLKYFTCFIIIDINHFYG